jgi:hypothetical protein
MKNKITNYVVRIQLKRPIFHLAISDNTLITWQNISEIMEYGLHRL